VLDEGELVGIGTHDTLMESCEVYRQIATRSCRRRSRSMSNKNDYEIGS
jgi:hypothetical protein